MICILRPGGLGRFWLRKCWQEIFAQIAVRLWYERPAPLPTEVQLFWSVEWRAPLV